MSGAALEIRCRYALCRVALIIEGAANAEEMEAEVYFEAFDLGRLSFDAGDPNLPVLFREEPFLVRAWKDGFATGYESSVLAEASSTSPAMSPAQLLSLLRETDSTEIEGFYLSHDEHGIWMTNPYGVDCAVVPFSLEGCSRVLSVIERTKNRVREWATL